MNNIEGKRIKGDAQRLVSILCDPTAPPEVLANALAQANRLHCFGTPRQLYQSVRSNPVLQFDKGRDKIVVQRAMQPRPVSLANLGQQAVSAVLQKTPFALDKRVPPRLPATPRVDTGTDAAKLLRDIARPAERARLVVSVPRIASAQLVGRVISKSFETDVSAALGLKSTTQALESASKPVFTPQEEPATRQYRARMYDGPDDISALVVTCSRQMSTHRRQIALMAHDNGPLAPWQQTVRLEERRYIAVDPAWSSLLPAQLFEESGLTTTDPLEPVHELLELRDPEAAVLVGAASWLHQAVRPAVRHP